MEVLQIFGSWDQETDSWFTNHEPLIPTLFCILFQFAFGLLQEKKLRSFITSIFWFIFVANNENNRSTFKTFLKYIWISFNFQWIQQKTVRTLSLISLTIIKNELILKAVPPTSGFYRLDLLSICWDTLR